MISVLMTVYNGERWLAEAIESVLNQTFTDFEFLIANDGSTDGSLEIAERYARQDSRIRVVSHPNWGISRALNHALQLVKTDWVARFDADDVMEPNRLERQLEFMKRHPDLAVGSCWARYIDHQGRVVGEYKNDLTTPEILRQRLADNQVIYVVHSGAIIRRDIVQEVGGYRTSFDLSEDTDLWNRIAEHGHLVLVQPEFLLTVRVHPSSATRTGSRRQAQQARWLEITARERRAGRRESTVEELERAEREAPWYRRLNQARQDEGQVLYKAAVIARVNGQTALMAATLAGSMLFYPSYCVSNVWTKAVRSRFK